MQQIIIRVTASGLVMAWSWIGVLGTEARNQQRKAKEDLATCCHSSYAFLPATQQGCSYYGQCLGGLFHSASLLESLGEAALPSGAAMTVAKSGRPAC